jgi:hypothetical protein
MLKDKGSPEDGLGTSPIGEDISGRGRIILGSCAMNPRGAFGSAWLWLAMIGILLGLRMRARLGLTNEHISLIYPVNISRSSR